MQYGQIKIEACKLAGLYDDKFYAIIDGLIDFDITSSKYAKIVIKRIKKVYYNQAFLLK